MEITNHTHPNHHIILVKGLVEEQAFTEIRQALATAPSGSDRRLCIDCSHINREQLSNNSIRSFVSELLKIRKEQVKIVLCGMDATTQRLFSLLNLDVLFSKARTAEEACLPAKLELAAA